MATNVPYDFKWGVLKKWGDSLFLTNVVFPRGVSACAAHYSEQFTTPCCCCWFSLLEEKKISHVEAHKTDRVLRSKLDLSNCTNQCLSPPHYSMKLDGRSHCAFFPYNVPTCKSSIFSPSMLLFVLLSVCVCVKTKECRQTIAVDGVGWHMLTGS